MGSHWGDPGRPHQERPGCMGIAAPVVGPIVRTVGVVARSVRAGWQPAAAYAACAFSGLYVAGQVARTVIG